MVLTDNDSFLTELTKLFQSTKTSGSVWLTVKKYLPPTSKKEATKTEGEEPKLLLRATNGDIKFRTVIPASQLTKFQTSYLNLLKSQMDNLKRKEKKKKKKATTATK
eukprot:TRINITY_DN5061_c0_g1_i4.p1 TRINITY_DN5061_c0_g1~~TRINITY_DN5061_c0_g1_i4.p1  ORF type:complete len:107 (+),score=25.73 TRINITY_DN5061_c0_g1_i4:96-416(+)